MPVQEIVMAEAKKIGVVGATFLVAGNMMGSGVFLLPSSLAKIGTASIWGWLITTAGALLLAFVFAKLGKLAPKAGGPYAYARDWFGPYMGFQTNTIYWFANWIGNVAIPIAAVGYFSYFFPILSEPLVRCIAVLVLVWALSFANVIGPAFVSRVQTVTTSFALVPILGIAIFGWFFFDADIFKGAYNVSGESNFGAISSAAALTLWAFIGVESASVTAGVVENRKERGPRHAGRRVPGRHRLHRQFLGDHGHGAQRRTADLRCTVRAGCGQGGRWLGRCAGQPVRLHRCRRFAGRLDPADRAERQGSVG
jgi:arginine:agmatine antiporter